MPVSTIKWVGGGARIIDQTKLPHKLVYADIRDVRSMRKAIKTLKVRGAPAIGVAGAFGVVLGMKDVKAERYKEFKKKLGSVIRYLGTSRPTAVNLFWALERMEACAEKNAKRPLPKIKESLLKEALKIMKEDQRTSRRMASFGAKLVKNGDRILTHCNAGGLATVDYGTALGVLFKAKEEGKSIKVFVNETRPLLQGARLTAWELMREKMDVTLICDNMAASLMKKKKIDKIFVGADRIAKNGDVANKIGTYNLAVLAKFHKIPFYVVAPISTFDFKLSSGDEIPIEERDADEIRTVLGKSIAPRGVKVYNPAFDVTPARLITAIVTEKGILKPDGDTALLKGTPHSINPPFNTSAVSPTIRARCPLPGEFEFIDRIKKIAKTKNAVLGIGDDCAVLKYTEDKYLLVTADMLVEDVHFDLSKTSAYKVGRKALAVSLSDIASMAGLPKYCLVSLAVPCDMPLNALDDFYSGLLKLALEFDVELVGGDTNRGDKFICDVCVIGEVEKKYLLRRGGAKAGDNIFVTGSLGGSIKGKHCDFTPRVKEARILVENFKIHSMIDISDGLSLDLYHITDASAVGAIIYDDCIPISQSADSKKEALSGGEDFELLFTAPSDVTEEAISKKLMIPVRKIGEIVPKREGVKIVKNNKLREFKKIGYRHF